jgi:lysozyme family protein
MTTFDIAFARLISIEQGFTNDPKDAGNWTGGHQGLGVLKGTKYGIAANTYPDLDIKNLTLNQAKAIYKRDWWDKIGADLIDSAIVFQLWDFAVNAGMPRAVMALQQSVNVTDDGRLGPMTRMAVSKLSVTDVIQRFNARRLRFYTKCSTWPTFGKGWVNRVADNLDYAAVDS